MTKKSQKRKQTVRLNTSHEETQPINISLLGYQIPSHHLAILILLMGCLARIVLLNNVPGGINQDEAFSGYEAYSLLHFGKDSSGYSFPVYLVTWGSGMNALNSYLMIPFLAIFGSHTWVIRLPQAIVACASLWVLYKLLQKLFQEQTALLGLFFFSICPWHLMMSRWGLESNLAPGFLLFGFYFFVLGIEHARYYLFSALFYGLSLYCYATIWPMVPFLIGLEVLYLLYTKKLKNIRYVWLSIVILALLALPLLLFLLVNSGHMEEVKTPFLSIPKLVVMRDNEISLSNIGGNFKNMVSILLQQNDDLYWNSTSEFGLYYKGTLVLFLFGLCICLKKAFLSLKERTFDGSVLCLIQLVMGAALGCLIEVNVNRINCIHIPIILMIVIGLSELVKLLQREYKHAMKITVILLLSSFFLFEHFYFTTYRNEINTMFQDGLKEAVAYAMELSEEMEPESGDIYLTRDFSYSKILLYSKLPVDKYIKTVEYTNYPSSFLDVSSFDKFHYDFDTITSESVYIIPSDSADSYRDIGCTVRVFQTAAVATYQP